jgi:hypothetical protein
MKNSGLLLEGLSAWLGHARSPCLQAGANARLTAGFHFGHARLPANS